jgi:hypothetical protein
MEAAKRRDIKEKEGAQKNRRSACALSGFAKNMGMSRARAEGGMSWVCVQYKRKTCSLVGPGQVPRFMVETYLQSFEGFLPVASK